MAYGVLQNPCPFSSFPFLSYCSILVARTKLNLPIICTFQTAAAAAGARATSMHALKVKGVAEEGRRAS